MTFRSPGPIALSFQLPSESPPRGVHATLGPLVRHPDGLGDGPGPLARLPGGDPAGGERRGAPQGGGVLDHRRPRRRPPLLRPVQPRLLPDAAVVADVRRLGGRARHPRGHDRRARDRRRLRAAPRPAAPALPGHHRPLGRPGPGDRPLGQFLQRGGLRAPHQPPVEALHLRAPAAPDPDRRRVLPPHLPLRIAVGPRSLPPPGAGAAAPARAGPGHDVPGVPRALFGRPVLDRGAADGQPDARALPGRPDREHPGRRAGRGRHSPPLAPGVRSSPPGVPNGSRRPVRQ